MNITESFNSIKFLLANKIGTLVINRPDKLNALNSVMMAEIKSLLQHLITMPRGEICGLIVTGEGDKAFIAGADIAEMSQMSPVQAQAFAQHGQDITFLFEALPFPVVSAVNGYALGGGLEMAMAADFILASRNAIFGLPEVKLGLMPGFGGTQRLAKYIGRNRAKELIYSGRNFNAEEAIRIGLILDLFDSKESMLLHAKNLLETVSKNSPLAIARVKEVMNDCNDLPLREGTTREAALFSSLFSSQDMREGCQAFMQKRAANFKGI